MIQIVASFSMGLALVLQGCGGGDKPTPAACVPMTATDPCFEKCHMGSPQNCTTKICKSAGKIGCKGVQCELMGVSGTSTSHCMSPTAPAPAPTPPKVPTVRINGDGQNGIDMPMMAFGTAKTSLSACSVQEGVEQWLRLGGRHIDTADDYGTQPDVGKALKATSVPRKDIFITTKIPGPIGKAAVIEKVLYTALPQLGLDYIDLVLIHFPCKGMDKGMSPTCGKEQAAERRDTWEGLTDLRKQGKIRAIGVSNYDADQVDEIGAAFQEYPAVNQVQYHLAYHNDTLLKHMKDVGTVLEAWASLGGPTVHGKEPIISLGDARLKEVAAKYGASTAQVVFRWETQKGVVPVTATCNSAHAIGDLGAFSFELSAADIALLDGLMPAESVVVV